MLKTNNMTCESDCPPPPQRCPKSLITHLPPWLYHSRDGGVGFFGTLGRVQPFQLCYYIRPWCRGQPNNLLSWDPIVLLLQLSSAPRRPPPQAQVRHDCQTLFVQATTTLPTTKPQAPTATSLSSVPRPLGKFSSSARRFSLLSRSHDSAKTMRLSLPTFKYSSPLHHQFLIMTTLKN